MSKNQHLFGVPQTARERRAALAEIERVNEELIGDCSREMPPDLDRTCQQLFLCQTCWTLGERWVSLRHLTRVSCEPPIACAECISKAA